MQGNLQHQAAESVVGKVASSPAVQAALWDHGWPIFPAEILENVAVGEPARRCWMVLWRWAGCKSGHVKCDAGSLMSALHIRSDRTIRGYRQELAMLGAIAIIDDGPRWLLYVNDPSEVSGERPQVKSPGRYRYLAFMSDEPETPTAAPAGTFCAESPAKTPAESPAGSFCAKTPAPELIAFEKIVAQRQAQEAARLARETPRTVGEFQRPPPPDPPPVARDFLGRPNVQRPDPPEHQDVLQDVRRVVEKDAQPGEGVGAGRPLTLGERVEAEVEQLVAQLGPPAALADAFTLVVAWLIDHALEEHQLRTLIANARADGYNAWSYAMEAFRQQLAGCPAEQLQQAGLWHATQQRPFEYRDVRLRQKLEALGLRWQRRWGHQRSHGREKTEAVR